MEKMNNNRARSLRQVRSSRSRSKRGVSPVIGVILMVAATIVIAGVVMAMLGGFTPPSATPPSVAVTLQAVNSTHFKLVHSSGDTLLANEWQIGVCKAGESPTYKSVDRDFKVGQVFIVGNTTDLANPSGLSLPGTLSSDTYEVYIKHLPTDALIISGKRITVG